VIRSVLNAHTVGSELALAKETLVLGASEFGEAPLVRHVDLLTSGKLEFGAAQSLDQMRPVHVLATDRQQRLADHDTSHCAQRFAVGATHARLQTIGAGARQHLVDANDVERMHPNATVEVLFADVLHHVLVAADAGGLERLGTQLFILVGDQVHAQRELGAGGLLATQVEDADLRVWHTTAMARLDVWLVLTVSVTSCWTSTHLYLCVCVCVCV
jgi:hypothetical protein